MDSNWIAWLAGLVEGEGTVGLARCNSKSAPRAYLRPHFQIANTDLRILNKAFEIVSGITGKCPVITASTRPKACRKTGYVLKVHTQWELLLLLPKLAPFLISKREQAEIVFAFCSRRSHRLARRKRQFWEQDEAAYARTRALNKRGITVESIGDSSLLSKDEDVLRATEESVEAGVTARLVN